MTAGPRLAKAMAETAAGPVASGMSMLVVLALSACARGGVATAPHGATGSSALASHGPPAPGTPAHRVVSISPATTEALFAIGAGDRVVGRSRFCDWPPAATSLPVVGGVIDADFEAIVELSPDLLVGGPGPSSTKLTDKLTPLGIAAWFPGIDSLDAIDDMLVGMGERTGHADDAHRIIDGPDGIRARVAAVEHAVADEPPPRVLMIVDVAPVVATGPKDFVDEMIRRARGANVLAAGGPWQTLGFEEIVELDPDVIVDASNADGVAGPSPITPRSQGWTDVRAAREGHVVRIDDSRVLRPGPRVAEGLAVLARALHPNAHVPSW